MRTPAIFNRALPHLDTAYAKDPLNPEVEVTRGTVLARAGQWSEAERVLQAVLARNPNDEAALRNLGNIAFEGTRDYNRAIDYFKRALALPASDITKASIENNLDSVYCETERCSEGIPYLEAAVKLDPRGPHHTNLGKALVDSGRTGEARVQLMAALQIDPQFQPAAQDMLTELAGLSRSVSRH
jgi:tetratricopeptide (TPR) repeat protein